jgi:ribosomal protein S18 acetylase RimI-like enzyme
MRIRLAQTEDAPAIAALLMLATGEVILRLLGEKNQTEAEALLLYFIQRPSNQYSYENCYVAEENGEIIGALLAYDGALLEALRNPVLNHIREHFNPEASLEDETEAGEFYIDSIGISPNHQGKGVGSRLLQHLIQDKVFEEGHTLGLLVDKTNPAAKKLYLKLGFQPVGEKTLLGIELEHLQLKKQ